MNIFVVFCGFLALSNCNESRVKSCIKHPDFQILIIRSLIGKFTDERLWNEKATPGELLVKFIVEKSKNADVTFFSEVLNSQNNHKLYKTRNLPTTLLHHPEIASKLWSSDGDKDFYEFENFISKSSDRFLDWFADSLKSFGEWLRENFHLLSGDFSEIGLKEMTRILLCLMKYSDEDFEDRLTWFSCFYVCRDLRDISKKIEEVFKTIPQCGGSEWIGDLIIRIFMDFVYLNDCYFEVLSPNETLVIEEGDLKKHFVKFQTFVSPGVHCFPSNVFQNKAKIINKIIKYVFGLTSYCKVKIEFSTSNYFKDFMPPSIGNPKCRRGSGIVQVAMEFNPDGINNKSADILLTTNNWNKTFVVPLVAVVDQKLEPLLESNLNFTIKMLVDGDRINSTKLPLKVIDKDSRNVAVCQSINDPHLVTFDNLYYNNLAQGYFLLYKNKDLPYEVQVIYQSCGPTIKESCNCAVAVKSYDDVFVVDKCRLRSSNVSEDNDESLRIMKVTLFLNGELNRGTRIFRKHGGLAYQLLLPHGTLINIKTNAYNFLNVWISPSSYDRNRTLGLCGTFNDLVEDELLHSDGGYSKVAEARKFAPHDFIASWRVKPRDRIFEGVEPTTDEVLNETCRCSHQLLKNISCKCGFDQFVESCHLDLGEEFVSTNISLIARKSKKNPANDSRDIDESFQSKLNFTGINLGSRKYCTSLLIKNSKLMKLCSATFLFKNNSRGPVGNAIEGCMDDLKITGNPQELSDEWKWSAIDAAKETCLTLFSRNPFFIGRMEKAFENETCVNQCFMRGTCISNKCFCNEGYSGADCSFEDVPNYKPTIFTSTTTTFCDTRTENCSYVGFFGKNFTEEVLIMCDAVLIKVTQIDKVESSKRSKVQAYFLSPNQAICVLPGTSRKYANSQEIRLSLETHDNFRTEVTLSKFRVVVYDSSCMSCDQTTCSLKEDGKYCFVENTCYEELEQHEDDPCLICNTSSSTKGFSNSYRPECVVERENKLNTELKERKDFTIRLVVSVSFSILVVIATAVTFIQDCKSSKKSVLRDDKANPKDKKSSEFVVMDAVNNRKQKLDKGGDEINNEKLFNSIDQSPKPSVGAIESNQLRPAEDEKSRSMSAVLPHFHHQKRQRTFSESSEKSYGIGGGGPILFGCHRRLSCISLQITNESCGIGGHSASLFASVASTPRGSRIESK